MPPERPEDALRRAAAAHVAITDAATEVAAQIARERAEEEARRVAEETTRPAPDR